MLDLRTKGHALVPSCDQDNLISYVWHLEVCVFQLCNELPSPSALLALTIYHQIVNVLAADCTVLANKMLLHTASSVEFCFDK